MINFQKVIDFIKISIKRNGKREITGDLLQKNLLEMVDVNKESYEENVATIAQKEQESIDRDKALGDRIDQEGQDLTELTNRVTENESQIDTIHAKDNEQDTRIDGLVTDTTEMKAKLAEHTTELSNHETRIQDNASNIAYNEEEIGRVAGIVDGHSQDITDIKHKDAEQDTEIANLKGTTQIKDLDVEVRNTGFGWVSSESAEEIYAHAIKGGNVKIQLNDKKYTFVEYKNRTAYFRYLNVDADKVTEESIEIYEKNVTFKTIDYQAIFDATPLLTSFQTQEPLTSEFISALDKALGEKKLIFVTGNNTIYLLIATNKTSAKRSFTGFGERTAYVLSYGSNRIVNLETHTIGGDTHIFNNENSVNILNLDTSSTNAEIKEVFTDAFGEVVIPHTGDVFNVYQNSDVTNSGIVASSVEDAGGIRLAVDMSNFEDNLIHRVFYNLNYVPSQGLDSLNITNKIDNVINPSLIAEDKVNARDAEIAKKANKEDVNEYNISAINSTPYASLQLAINALDAYLTEKGIAKSVGVKVTFVQTDIMKAKTYSFVKMGRFTDVANWQESGAEGAKPKGGYNRALYESMPNVVFNEKTGFYEVWKDDGGLSDVTEEQMAEIRNASLTASAGGCINGSKARAIIPVSITRRKFFQHKTWWQFANCDNIEYIRLTTNDYCEMESIAYSFMGSYNVLKKIVGGIYTKEIAADIFGFGLNFFEKLTTCLIACGPNAAYNYMKYELLPNLDYESFKYLVTNSVRASTAQTLKVHPSRFALLSGTASPDEYLATGHTKEEWQKIVTDAQALNVTIAQ